MSCLFLILDLKYFISNSICIQCTWKAFSYKCYAFFKIFLKLSGYTINIFSITSTSRCQSRQKGTQNSCFLLKLSNKCTCESCGLIKSTLFLIRGYNLIILIINPIYICTMKYSWESIKSQLATDTWLFNKGNKTFNRERITFPWSGAGMTGHPQTADESGLLQHTMCQHELRVVPKYNS